MRLSNITDQALLECLAEYNKLDAEKALQMSHFDLAKATSITDRERWVDFLKHPQIEAALEEELTLYKKAQQRKIIAKTTSNDKSVGTAQMLTALEKLGTDASSSGSIMIYSYVPLNTHEANSEFATAELTDIFDKVRVNKL